LRDQSSVTQTTFMSSRRSLRVLARHMKRYLGLGAVGWTHLLRRAGMEDSPPESFSLAQAKTLMKFHFVMLAERKPTKWKRTSRYQANRGLEQRPKIPPRRIHPTVSLVK
jgi:hypothetical protein